MSFCAKMRKEYETAYKVMSDEMEGSALSAGFIDLVDDIWEAFGNNGILERVEYQPMDSFGGSVCIYLTTMPGGYFLRLWYSHKQLCYMSGIFKHVVGAIAHLIPETFNAEGVFKIKNLEQFTEHFVTIMVKERYNQEHTVRHTKTAIKPLLEGSGNY